MDIIQSTGAHFLPQEGKTASISRPAPISPKGTYVELKQILKQRGLLEKQPLYYTWRITLLCLMLGLGIFALLSIHILWIQLLDAVYLAFVCTQVGLLSHEAAHRQMFHRGWLHDLVGLLGGTLIIGMSYGWWLDKHNTHHSHPNQLDTDPDVSIPFLEFTGTEDLATVGALRRFLIKYQAWIFLPALMTVGIGLQYDSVNYLLHKKPKYRILEAFLMLAHFVLYMLAVFTLFSFWPAVLFIVLHQALTGFYLGSIFAPNHKGMPVLEKDTKIDFMLRQIMTARNIYAHPITDFVYGGLNYQIEHHLFPAMARNKLKTAQPIIKDFCQQHNIAYHETTVIQSFSEILHHLYEIGAPLRRS